MSQIEPRKDGNAPARSFRLDKGKAKLFGVCAGIANYFGVDTTMVRVAFVITTLIGMGSPILVYLAIALIAD